MELHDYFIIGVLAIVILAMLARRHDRKRGL